MVKMTIRSDDKEIEFEGEKAEILDIYYEIMETSITFHAPKHTVPSKPVTKVETLKMKPPTDDDLIEYILSRPKYSHDIIEIEKHFLGKRIAARSYPSLYRTLANQLKRVRKKIEEEKQGEFEAIRTKARNLKRYAFHPRAMEKVFA